MRLCINNQTAFGGILQQLVEFTSILLRPEPFTRLSGAVNTLANRPLVLIAVKPLSTPGTGPRLRLWCSHCCYPFTYTLHTPFEARTLTPGEIITAFILYADPLLSINQVAQLFKPVYDTVQTTIREVGAAFESGFHLVWTHLQGDGDSPTQIDETGQKCSGFKGKTPPRERSSRGGDGDPGRSR
jgi:hypothetical protein